MYKEILKHFSLGKRGCAASLFWSVIYHRFSDNSRNSQYFAAQNRFQRPDFFPVLLEASFFRWGLPQISFAGNRQTAKSQPSGISPLGKRPLAATLLFAVPRSQIPNGYGLLCSRTPVFISKNGVIDINPERCLNPIAIYKKGNRKNVYLCGFYIIIREVPDGFADGGSMNLTLFES